MRSDFLILCLGALLISGCIFKEDPYENDNPGPKTKFDLPYMDSVRDKAMRFHVYDSLTGQLIGEEDWQYSFSTRSNSYDYMAFNVSRYYATDSSGGFFFISKPDEEGRVFRSEFGLQRNFYFLLGRGEKWYPQDSVNSMSISELIPGKTKYITRSYLGVTEVPYQNRFVFAHRAGRDSTARDGVNPPYRMKREDYYFAKGLGLIYMQERNSLFTGIADSTINLLVKKRVF